MVNLKEKKKNFRYSLIRSEEKSQESCSIPTGKIINWKNNLNIAELGNYASDKDSEIK